MVQVLVPKKPDHRVLRTAARTYYDELSAENVEVRTYGPRMIHAKTLVIDRQLAIIGSANMDNRSFRLNFEVVAALYGEEPASRLASIFRDDLRSSEPFEPRKRTPMHIRFVESLARLFSPIL
jgi:cardiolipin synthase